MSTPKDHIATSPACCGPYGGLWRLHDAVETPVGPKLADPFVDHLDGMRHADTADGDGPEGATLDDLDAARKDAALARLRDDHALLYGVVYLTDLRGLSLRETGRHLNLDHHTVKKHRAKGLAYVRALCGDMRQAG